jgi:hypothetical protein
MAANQMANQKGKQGSKQQSTQNRPQTGRTSEEETGGSYGSIGEMAEQASDYVSRGATQAYDYAREHAGTSVVIALATGFGIGLLVGHAIGSPRRNPQSWRDRIAAEGLGRRFMERVEGFIPDALAQHFGK